MQSYFGSTFSIVVNVVVDGVVVVVGLLFNLLITSDGGGNEIARFGINGVFVVATGGKTPFLLRRSAGATH